MTAGTTLRVEPAPTYLKHQRRQERGAEMGSGIARVGSGHSTDGCDSAVEHSQLGWGRRTCPIQRRALASRQLTHKPCIHASGTHQPAAESPTAARSLEPESLTLALEYASAKDVREGAARVTVKPGLTVVPQPFAPIACTVTSTSPWLSTTDSGSRIPTATALDPRSLRGTGYPRA
jgi:hypothetical protein